MHLRLQTIGERKTGGLPTWTSFLARRMAPAIRTVATLEERQANLAEKLARAANLLRTRVDVELESQNRDNRPTFALYLRGRVEFACMVDPSKAAGLREALRKALGE